MQKLASLLIIPATALTLSACGADMKRVNPTPDSITVVYEDTELSVVTQDAMAYCSEQGRSAKMRNVQEVDGEKVAIFDCV